MEIRISRRCLVLLPLILSTTCVQASFSDDPESDLGGDNQVGAAISVPPPIDATKARNELNELMSQYYKNPQPERLLASFYSCAKSGVVNDKTVQPIMTAFLSEVFQANPSKLSQWKNEWMGLKPAHRNLIWVGLWYADTESAEKVLQDVASNGPAQDKRTCIELLNKQTVPYVEQPLNPLVLDELWACYSASGDSEFVLRIMDALPLTDLANATSEQRLIGEAAMWSLKSNCRKHEAVMKICMKEKEANPKMRKYLDKVTASEK